MPDQTAFEAEHAMRNIPLVTGWIANALHAAIKEQGEPMPALTQTGPASLEISLPDGRTFAVAVSGVLGDGSEVGFDA
ncbi:hypothetical protein [Nocardia wallacei]|uniref:hypothetical protein n=1 Tax=Nocardia wallacei TaxID=480035 RepID=UPI002458AC3F|nr:hypothetical protein [Nocardia wallacei]